VPEQLGRGVEEIPVAGHQQVEQQAAGRREA
jgi:hypothetical protein